jgi:hypothetical protein
MNQKLSVLKCADFLAKIPDSMRNRKQARYIKNKKIGLTASCHIIAAIHFTGTVTLLAVRLPAVRLPKVILPLTFWANAGVDDTLNAVILSIAVKARVTTAATIATPTRNTFEFMI